MMEGRFYNGLVHGLAIASLGWAAIAVVVWAALRFVP